MSENAREKAIERLAFMVRGLQQGTCCDFAEGLEEMGAKIIAADPDRNDLDFRKDIARDVLDVLGLVAVDRALIEACRHNSPPEICDICQQGNGYDMCNACEGRLALADVVLAQVPE